MLDRANVKISMLTWALYQLQVVQEALDQANVSETDLSAVAVTIGPGFKPLSSW
jgi:tRNA A37 threonylcarbamoyltransferase TsaD